MYQVNAKLKDKHNKLNLKIPFSEIKAKHSVDAKNIIPPNSSAANQGTATHQLVLTCTFTCYE